MLSLLSLLMPLLLLFQRQSEVAQNRPRLKGIARSGLNETLAHREPAKG